MENNSAKPALSALFSKYDDSGATDIMVSNSKYFINLNELENKKAKVANGSFIDIKGIGIIQIKINNVLYNLENCLYIPDLTSSLFGIKHLISCTGLKILFNENIVE
ncbi:hypothetical protein ROZALSC1DRAFT_31979, partial [Rozella allomycis CSF55]